MASRLFGFSIEGDNDPTNNQSPVPPNEADGVDYYASSGAGFYGSYLDLEGVYKNESELIRRYREMSLHPEVDSAIEDVVNEAIVSDTYDSPVQIELSNLNASEGIKKIIRKEFKLILELLDFDRKAHEIYRNWYVDGRLYYHKVIDLKRPNEGIQELRYIDALKMRYIRKLKDQGDKTSIQSAVNPAKGPSLRGYTNPNTPMRYDYPEIEEYFLYTPTSTTGQGDFSYVTNSKHESVKFTKDAITYCTSGLVDRNKGLVLSYLHKAIKSLNQLRMIEDSLVIYRLSRAPERRIFYIDVGNLPKVKSEQYLRDVMNRYRNKLVYNAQTGELRDDNKMMSMMEDFWLPRREGGRGTEITTLPGGQNLGEISDIQYFLKKLYKSLNIPESRIGGDGGFNLGRSSEILRDEVKFSKFVGRLRKRFSFMFQDMLKTQLLLKNIITLEDWDVMEEHIQYDFLYDNHFTELKEAELMTERLNLLATAEPYIGRYYSQDYIRRHILRQTDSEIIEENKKIEKEIKDGIIPDPNMPIDPVSGEPLPSDSGGDLGAPVMEPESDGSSTEAPEVKIPKSMEI